MACGIYAWTKIQSNTSVFLLRHVIHAGHRGEQHPKHLAMREWEFSWCQDRSWWSPLCGSSPMREAGVSPHSHRGLSPPDSVAWWVPTHVGTTDQSLRG